MSSNILIFSQAFLGIFGVLFNILLFNPESFIHFFSFENLKSFTLS